MTNLQRSDRYRFLGGRFDGRVLAIPNHLQVVKMPRPLQLADFLETDFTTPIPVETYERVVLYEGEVVYWESKALARIKRFS